MSKVVIEDI